MEISHKAIVRVRMNGGWVRMHSWTGWKVARCGSIEGRADLLLRLVGWRIEGKGGSGRISRGLTRETKSTVAPFVEVKRVEE